ncbi:MAG: DUF5683 domain-containing protein [Cyclobacteriaceae bacterium]|nr:DUF5683 domain-containing protein [Cyclobacteriaceae bacterium]
MIYTSIIAVFVLLAFCSKTASGQVIASDTVEISLNDKDIKDPKKATLLSAILPGAGQVYNNKAWKAPIIYGGFATNIFFIHFNNTRYKALKEGLLLFDQNETNNFPNLNRDGLVRQVNYWRRNRDLNYFLFVGIYALIIIDAQVDAHLSGFDVSEDLSFRFEPSFETLTAGGNIFGLSMKITF